MIPGAALLLTVAGLVQAPALQEAEAPTVGVEGVVQAVEGQPIAYAQVQVVERDLADWTDARGRYDLHDLGPGRWRIRVVHPGHEPMEVGVYVPDDRAVRLDVSLTPRPSPTPDALADFEPFRVEYTLPALQNPEQVSAVITDRYPEDLIRGGVGGEAVLLLWLDEGGRVVRSRVEASSGTAALDSLALEVSHRMRFRPAKNRGEAVRVIVRIPVYFTVPDSLQDRSSG
ncbi:MAG: TonB family protein [Gemmatimonadota bacterium]